MNTTLAGIVRSQNTMGSVFALLFLLLVVGLLVWCVIKPSVGRRFARIFSVLAIGVGIGVLVWGICTAGLGESIRGPRFITQPGEAIGWGAGTFAAGVTALILSFIPSRKGKVHSQGEVA